MVGFFRVDPPIAGHDIITAPSIYTNAGAGRWFNILGDAINYFNTLGYEWDFESLWVTKTDAQRDVLLSLGFPFVISRNDVSIGDRFYLENGSWIEVVDSSGSYGLNLKYQFYNEQGVSTWYNLIVPGSETAAQTLFPSYTLSNEGTIRALTIQYIDSSRFYIAGAADYNAQGTFLYFYNGVAPLGPYDIATGPSGPGGGDGEYDDETEANPMSSLPTASFVDAGFCRIYNPSLSQLKSLSQYLWTDTTFLQTVINHLKQLLENPMDAIISLSLLPVPIQAGAPEEVKVMYIPTGVYMPPAMSQFVDVDCGTLTINKNIGCALDYNPYTRIHLYLPYIGQVTLNTDEVMGKTLHLIYRVDIVTGICAAFITVNGNVMYVFSGHCSVSQPLTSADFSGYINAMITAAKTVAAIAAGAGGAPGVAAGLAGTSAPRTRTTTEIESASYTTRNPKTGRQITRGTSEDQFQRVEQTGGASFGELAAKTSSNTVAAVMNSKLVVEHANGFGGNSGYLAQRTPFLIIERPRLCNPKEYATYNGYPSMMYLNLGDCSGYTEVQQVHLTGMTATNPELSEISELLKSGVVL